MDDFDRAVTIVSHDLATYWVKAGSPFRSVGATDGATWAQYYRDGDAIVVEFPRIARFRVAPDGLVACGPVPSVAKNLIQHLYQNYIVPLMWSRTGSLGLHAGAINTPIGAVAFVGESGSGKSTLSMYIARHGYPLLTDDTLLLERRGAKFMALPGPSEIGLWPDSGKQLLGDGVQKMPALDHIQKGRYLAAKFVERLSEAAPLSRVCILGDGAADEVSLSRSSGADALFSITNSSFLLDHLDPVALADYFENATTLCKTVEIYSLDYPRRYDVLEQVKDAVLGSVSLL